MPARCSFLVILILLLRFTAFSQEAHRGVLDLRDIQVGTKILSLDGEWEFYWKKLYSSSQLDTLAQKDFFVFPHVWNSSETVNGVPLTSKGFGTYRLTVLLPEDHPQLAFRIKHFYSSYSLYVNGELKAQNGQVGETEEDYLPHWLPVVEDLSADVRDTLVIDLQIANFSHHKGGSREPIYFSSKTKINGMATQILAFDLLLAGSLIMAGLFFMGLYFFNDKQNYVIHFALFCLLFSVRIISADDYTLHVMYPSIPWAVSLRFEYLSLFLPPALYALYTESLYPGEAPYRILRWFASISFLLSITAVLLPTRVFTGFVEPYLFLTLGAIVVHGITYVRAYRHKRAGANYAMISAAMVLVAASYKIMIYMTGAKELEVVSFIGFLSFFFFQSLILFFIFTNSLKEAKENAEAASRSKSEFLSMMSHEIRTPMNAVVGLTNFLIEDNPKKSQIETLNTLNFSAKNLLVIINDILDFSKIEAKKITFDRVPVNIKNLVDEIYREQLRQAVARKIAFSLDIDPRIPEYIVCDPTRTSQVLINLISNAIKFTKRGSVSVKLDLVSRTVGQVEIGFSITDTGIGIAEEMQGEIFKSFTQGSKSTTREFGGTGLGLAITKELLSLQGVDLELKSKLKVGSTFSFTQRFEIGESSETVKKRTKRERIDGVKVLLVEDNEINVMVAKKFLSKWGAETQIAKNGLEALTKYDDSIAIIIMDLQMPVMDGYEASRKIREKGSRVPILALTASALIEEQRKIYSAGIDDFVTKPFDPEVLLTKIRKYTRSKPEEVS